MKVSVMLALVVLVIISISCTDPKDRCYDCTVKFSTDIYQQPTCGYNSAKKAEDYLEREYGGNVVINGQTLKSIDCVNSKN